MTDATRSTVTVCGAAGFVGRYVVAELARRGHAVIATSLDEVEREAVPNVEWRRVDLDRDDLALLAASTCIHLAEPSALSSEEDARANAKRAARLAAVAFERFVYVSSAVVYGDRSSKPHAESSPVVAGGVYAAAKLGVEQLLASDPRVAIVRLANVYGRGMSPRNVLSDILAQLSTSGPLRVRDLAPVRDYVHVRDVAIALAMLAESRLTGVINIGTGRGASVAELARLACSERGTPDRELVATNPGPPGSALVLDTTRARQELHWTPAVPLEQGLAELIRETAT